MKIWDNCPKKTELWDVEKKEPYITVDNEKWKSQYGNHYGYTSENSN